MVCGNASAQATKPTDSTRCVARAAMWRQGTGGRDDWRKGVVFLHRRNVAHREDNRGVTITRRWNNCKRKCVIKIFYSLPAHLLLRLVEDFSFSFSFLTQSSLLNVSVKIPAVLFIVSSLKPPRPPLPLRFSLSKMYISSPPFALIFFFPYCWMLLYYFSSPFNILPTPMFPSLFTLRWIN